MSLNPPHSTKYLFFAILGLVGLSIIFWIASIFNQEQYPISETMYPTDILYIILPTLVIILGTFLSIKNRFKGNHGKAWIFFTLAMVSFLVAESTYSYDSELDLENISTLTSDIFYLLSYPLLLTFTIFYLKPRRRIISKNIIVTASLISVIFVIPSLYFTIGIDDELSGIETAVYGFYPILSGIILVPSIIAVILFFRGKVNLLWTLVLLATFTTIAADTIYLTIEIGDSYDIGNPVDILFLWSYVLYALGVWSYIRLYKTSTQKENSVHF